MGSAQSKRIEKEESVVRCRERKQLMRDAVSSRNAFASAHSACSVALKSSGAALTGFAEGESPSSSSSSAAAATAAVKPPLSDLPPPPPPLPDFSPSPLHRSASMPDLPPDLANINKPQPSIQEEEDGDDENPDPDPDPIPDPNPPPPPAAAAAAASPPPPPPAAELKGMDATWEYFFGAAESMPAPSLEDPLPQIDDDKFKKASLPVKEVGEGAVDREKEVAETPQPAKKQRQAAAAAAPALEGKKGKLVPAAAAAAAPPPQSVSLVQAMKDLDEDFLKMFEAAHNVSNMLEATRMHYHSSFADNQGHFDHSARVMQVITWNRSLKGIPNTNVGMDDFDSDEWETHAAILDKMLAWEKKLYDEVKAGELMKIDYQKKVALLNKQKKHGANPEVLEKTKSVVSHLHTRYIVDMQSMDSTVSEINRLRDDWLCPKLVELVDGMAKMWETMYVHHSSQLKIAANLRSLDISLSPKETSDQHHEWTIQLWEVLKEWHSQFQKLMIHQKAYIRALNGWLKLNLVPIESSLKEKVSSPPRVHTPPIHALLHEWQDQLEKLPDELARGALHSFSEVIHGIVIHQEDELKLKERCEGTRREYMRKAREFEDWYHKYQQKRTPSSSEEADPEIREGANHEDPVVEKRFVVEAIKLRLESEVEAHQKLCKQVREKSLGSLKTHFPELFRAMSDFARVCSEMYRKLQARQSDK